MHKRYPGVTDSKKVWAAAPWAQYVIKVEGVYIAFSDIDVAAEYAEPTAPLHVYSRNWGKGKQANG